MDWVQGHSASKWARLHALVVALLTIGAFALLAPAAHAASTVGSFEIDGNIAHDATTPEPIDWASPPPNLTSFTDVSNPDNGFTNGSKETIPSGWSCSNNASSPGKSDIVSGQIAFRTIGATQYAYLSYTRADTNGSADIDFDLTKGAASNTTCPQLPQRSDGDIVIAFDANQGGSQISVQAFKWSAATSTLVPFNTGSQGTTWDAAVNIPNTIPGHTAGDFGEIAIDLTDTVGTVSCGALSKAFITTRSSASISASMMDLTTAQNFSVGPACPQSTLAKAVRDVTKSGTFQPTASASAGDTVEYQLSFTNSGAGTAHNVVLSDTLPAHETFASCSDTCSHSATSVTWPAVDVPGNTTITRTFRVTLDSLFPDGDTTIPNTGSFTDQEEGTQQSNQANVTVTAHPHSVVTKGVRDGSTGGFASSTNAQPGDTLTYQLSYQNTGSANATGVTLSDPIPAHTSYVAGSCSPACTTSGSPVSSVSFSLGTVAPSSTATTVTFQVKIDPAFDGSSQITNTATGHDTEEGDTPSGGTTVTVLVPSSSLGKTAADITTSGSPGTTITAHTGDVIEYTLSYKNNGTGTAHSVTLMDAVPTHSTFLSCSNTCGQTGTPTSAVSWNLGDVAAGAPTITRTFRVTLDSTFPNGTTAVTNTATTMSTEEGAKSSNGVTVNVTAAPNSTLAKGARDATTNPTGAFTTPITANPGDIVEYQLTYDNTGNAPASNVSIGDPIPPNTTFVSCSNSCTQASGTVSWSLGTQNPSDPPVVRTFKVQIAAGFTGAITNTATVTTSEESSKNSNGATVNVLAPHSTLTKTAQDTTTSGSAGANITGNPGDTIVYKLSYSNTGNGDAHNVVISDPIPARTTYQSCTGGCSTSGTPASSVSWTFATVAAGGSQTVTFTVKLDATFPAGTTTVGNTGHVTTTEEPNGADSNGTTVMVSAGPSSHLAKAVRDATSSGSFASTITADTGDTLEYQLTYTNTGTANASNVVLSDVIPANTTFVSCSSSCSTTSPAGSVSWSFPSVAPNSAPIVVTFQVKITLGFSGPITNVANVNTQEEGNTPSGGSTVNVVTPSSSLTKSATDTRTGATGTNITASPGDTIVYTLKYTNSGTGDAHSVVVSDPVPARTTFVSCTAGCSTDGPPVANVTWNLGTVAAGSSQTVTFTVNLDSVFPNGTTTVGNTGHVTTSEEPNGTNSGGTTVMVSAAPKSNLTKSATDVRTGETGTTISAVPGDTITYTLRYTNSGNASATNVVVGDPIPAHSTLVAGSCTPACTTSGSPTVTSVSWSLGTVPPNAGSPVVVTFQVKLDPTLPAGNTAITNVGTVTTAEETGTTTTTTTVTVNVTATANLTLAKTATHASPSPTAGDTIVYTLTYGNTGNGNASGTTITEAVPSGTSYTSCTGGCTTTGNPVNSVSWNTGTVNGGTSNSVTMTVTVAGNVTCTVANTAKIASPDENSGALISSNPVTVNTTPPPNPAGAHASGNALGASVQAPLLKVNVTLTPTSSSQSGVGANSGQNNGLSLLVPSTGATKGSLLNAGVLQTTSTSAVIPNPAKAEDVTTAETLGLKAVSVLGIPLVTADTARSVADATATGTDAHYSSAGSTFSGLKVAGLAVNNIYPNEIITIPNLLGISGYVVVDEVTGSTSGPASGQHSGGTYSSDVTVNALHIHVNPGGLLGNQPIDVVVSHAVAHADFPQTQLCGSFPTEAVSGHAFIASETTNPALVPVISGASGISTFGGSSSQSIDSLAVPTNGSLLTLLLANSSSVGSFNATSATSTDTAGAASVCLLRASNGTCTVGASAITVKATSTANASGAVSNDTGTTLVGLQVLGVSIPLNPAPNTTINLPNIGFVTLNEQTCDNGTLANHTCGGANGHTGMTVRAIHIVVTKNALGILPGVNIVVAEAHSDATFVP